jgi:transaldolase
VVVTSPRVATSALDELRKHTVVVADSGEWKTFAAYDVTDATTNPSLILAAASAGTADPDYKRIVDGVVDKVRAGSGEGPGVLSLVSVAWGVEILKHVPGRVSTEVDARLSYDTDATVALARQVVGMYSQAGVSRDRVLVKIAATWEGIRACEVLQAEGINCNMTLVFSLIQAVACARAKATLISPFAGRITDWFKQKQARTDPYPAAEDPGVMSVKAINACLKHHGLTTQVMGASFRTVDQVLELVGADLLTISPKLLGELQALPGSAVRAAAVSQNLSEVPPKFGVITEPYFRSCMAEDEMATSKLDEGIKRFSADIIELEKRLAQLTAP